MKLFSSKNYRFAFLAFLLMAQACGNEPNPSPGESSPSSMADSVTATPVEAPPATVKIEKDSGATTTKKLDCGVSIQLRENGMESKVLNVLEGNADASEQGGWLNFDQVYFEEGKANPVMTTSAKQLITLASILKCYPKAKLKIGINTAKEGGKTAFTKLDEERILAIKATLAGLGVPGENLGSEVLKIENQTSKTGNATNHQLAIQVVTK